MSQSHIHIYILSILKRKDFSRHSFRFINDLLLVLVLIFNKILCKCERKRIMKNIEYLLAKTEIPKYNKGEIRNILKDECDIQGTQKQLVRCMEEFSELIEAIITNNIYGKINHINLAEEMADCLFCLEVLGIMYGIEESDIDRRFHSIYTGDNILNNCILNLTTSSIKLSKCVREKPGYVLKVIGIITLIYETLDNLADFYKVDMDIVKDIFMLKIKRSDERNKRYWEMVRNNYDKDMSNEHNARTGLTREEACANMDDIEVVSSTEIIYGIGDF